MDYGSCVTKTLWDYRWERSCSVSGCVCTRSGMVRKHLGRMAEKLSCRQAFGAAVKLLFASNITVP